MITVERRGSVGVVRLDNHAKRNALDEAVCVQLRAEVEALAELADDQTDPVRAIVLTGAGTVFCAGADLSGGVYSTGFYDAHAAALRTLESVPVPVVAAVNGPAIGAGVQLALAADLRVADPSAVFAVPVVKVGLALDTWTVRRLSNVVGGGHARGLLFTAQPLGVERAEQIGLVNQIGTLDDALQLAAELASFAPLSLRHIKAVVNDDDARQEPPEHHLEAQHRAWHSEDVIEARSARVEKRPPSFRGR